jgi:hypothetical protein
MDSGIYQLTFLNGDTYVGKSLHLETRWRQHADKLSKGTAAKNMLRAYYLSDHCYPQATVLVNCHPDLLDEYEGYWINFLKPTLNTQVPKIKTEAEQWALIRHMERGNQIYSTATTLMALENMATKAGELENEVDTLKTAVQELELDYELLDESWTIRAVRDARANAEYRKLEADLEYWKHEANLLATQCRSAEQRWFRVLKANWWQRLWKLW